MDDQVQLFPFSLSTGATVELVSLAYGGGTNSAGQTIPAGGFDTFFTLYAGDGSQIATNDDDSSCTHVHPGNSGCLDSYISEALPVGNYTLALTESGNDPNGNLSDGFSEQGQGNFTCPQGFCDAFGSQQNGTWAVDLRNVNAVSGVPEPATLALGCVSLALLGTARFRRASNRPSTK